MPVSTLFGHCTQLTSPFEVVKGSQASYPIQQVDETPSAFVSLQVSLFDITSSMKISWLAKTCDRKRTCQISLLRDSKPQQFRLNSETIAQSKLTYIKYVARQNRSHNCCD